MTDVSPEIYEKIKERYDELVAADKDNMAYVSERIQAGDIHYSVAEIYAERSGQYLSQAMREVMKLDDLPDGKLYYNIAEKTIGRALEDNYKLLSEAARVAQENMNREAGIGLKAAVPEMNTDRIHRIVDAAATAETQEKLDAALDEPVKTYSKTVIDDSKRVNAKLHYEAGLEVRVEREYDGVGLHNGTDVCDWCLERAGAWTYEKAIANGVFARHDGCGCIIDYTSKKGERSRSTSKWGFERIEEPEKKENMLLKTIENNQNQRYNLLKDKSRATPNPEYTEPMTKRHVRTIMNEMGVSYGKANIILERDKELVGKGLCGYTSPDGKSVTFYPDAFISREILVKTIGHEKIHLTQIKERGPATDSVMLGQYEREAYASEEKWWTDYQKNKLR